MGDLQAELARLEAEMPLDEFEALIRWWKEHWGRAAAYQAAAPPECMDAILRKTTDPVEALNGIVAVLSTVHPQVIDTFLRKLDGWLEVVRLLRVAVREEASMRLTMEACAAALSAAAAPTSGDVGVVGGEQGGFASGVEPGVGGDRFANGRNGAARGLGG
ncbi:MAG TPA: hypothetical protein VGB14_06095 [Acidimicrobiales bacterium]